MHAVILHIVGATSPFDKLNDGTTPTWFSWESTSVLLRSLFNLNYCCRRSETIRSAFLEIFYRRQPENRSPDIQIAEIQEHGVEIYHTASEIWSTAEEKQ